MYNAWYTPINVRCYILQQDVLMLPLLKKSQADILYQHSVSIAAAGNRLETSMTSMVVKKRLILANDV